MRRALQLRLVAASVAFATSIESGSRTVAQVLAACLPDRPESHRTLGPGVTLRASEVAEFVALPFVDERPLIGHRSDSAGYRFSALGGQRLDIGLDRRSLAGALFGAGAVGIDLYRINGGVAASCASIR
jgi:hypothetical protein